MFTCLVFISLLHLLSSVSSFKFMDGSNGGPRISVAQGELEGKYMTTKTGFEYCSFQGIPYAQPPIGDLRFRDPLPLDKWGGVIDATEVGSGNTQYDLLLAKKFYGEEDCLFLNVYVPKNAERPLPVMVWIHGGGYVAGDGSPALYGPDYLVEKNVILVTINYRLGVLGFLSLNTPDVPGNAGMKDQNLALKWVKKNINNFGGDAEKITIFGVGTCSIHNHVVSPMSKGLFAQAIVETGGSTTVWNIQRNPEGKAFEVGEILGLKTGSKDELVQYLRTIPVNDLVMASLSPTFFGKIDIAFTPVIEQNFPNTEAFLNREPLDILKSGDFNRVTMILGLNSKDGMIFMTTAFINAVAAEDLKNNRVPDLKPFVPDVIIAKYGEKGIAEATAKIKNFYFAASDNPYDGWVKLITDYCFVFDVVSALKYHAEFSPPVFYYKFSFSGSRNIMRVICGQDYTETAHSDEIGYLFRVNIEGVDDIPPTESDVIVTERMVQMWTNFAKYGNPTPETSEVINTIWKPITPNDLQCLEINEELNLIPDPFAEGVQFWRDMFEM